MVANASVGVLLDRVAGEFSQIGPSLEATRVAGGNGRHCLPAAVRGERLSRVEGGGEVRSERVEDGLGTAGGELD
jgi:hypothetical protein